MNHLTFDQLPQAVGQLQQKLESIEQLLLSKPTATPTPEPDNLLTIQQAAELLHLSVPTLYGKVHAREIPFSKVGKRLYFSRAELMQWVAAGRQKTTTEIKAEAAAYTGSPKKKGGSHV